MSINHHNFDYSGTTPLALNDRYYGQDLARDFQFHREDSGRLAEIMSESLVKAYFSGGIVTKGAGDTLDITPAFGFPKFAVEVPNDISSRPGTKQTISINRVYVESTQQTNMAIGSATLDGGTTNYVKLAYSVSNGTSRSREFASGSYAYERIPGFTITVDSTPATNKELLLATFTGTGGGAFTIANLNPQFSFPEADTGFGRVPTTDFDFYRSTENITLGVETDKVDGIASVRLVNDVQSWLVQVSNTDFFRVVDSTNSKNPFLIKPDAIDNSLYIDTTGNIGLGMVADVAAAYRLQIFRSSASAAYLVFFNSDTGSTPASDGFEIGITSAEEAIFRNHENTDMLFYTNALEHMRIHASGLSEIKSDDITEDVMRHQLLIHNNVDTGVTVGRSGIAFKANTSIGAGDAIAILGGILMIGGTSDDGSMEFYNRNAGTVARAMQLDQDNQLIIYNDGYISMDERAAAPANAAGFGKIWVKNTAPTELWFTDDTGTDTKII